MPTKSKNKPQPKSDKSKFGFNNLVITSLVVGFLIIGLSISYYFLITLPNIQSEKINFEKEKYQSETQQKESEKINATQAKSKAKEDLDECLSLVEDTYTENWNSACSGYQSRVNQDYSACIKDRESSYNSCLNGLSAQYCAPIWLDDKESYCKSKYSVTKSDSGSCLLPGAQANSIEESRKSNREQCYKDFELSIE